MNKTHYEKLIEYFPFIEDLCKELNKELTEPGFSFDKFIKTSIMSECSRMNQFGYRELINNSQLLFHIFSFYLGPSRIYEVKDTIAEMLLNTKLDIDCSMIKSPFNEIMILPPEGLLLIYHEKTGDHKLSTIYCNLSDNVRGYKSLKILCIGSANEKSLNEFDDATFYFRVDLIPGKKISECLKNEIDQLKYNPLTKILAEAGDLQAMPRLFNFVVNVLLYITSADNDIRLEQALYKSLNKKLIGLKSNAKIKKLKNRLNKESKSDRYIVGGSILLSPQEKIAFDTIKNRKHKIRYPVGGHWRMQVYGPKNNQFRKPKWIRPHFRGPELAEIINNRGILV